MGRHNAVVPLHITCHSATSSTYEKALLELRCSKQRCSVTTRPIEHNTCNSDTAADRRRRGLYEGICSMLLPQELCALLMMIKVCYQDNKALLGKESSYLVKKKTSQRTSEAILGVQTQHLPLSDAHRYIVSSIHAPPLAAYTSGSRLTAVRAKYTISVRHRLTLVAASRVEQRGQSSAASQAAAVSPPLAL